MAKRTDERGLFQRGRRWYLRVYVRGEGKKIVALKPTGETHATTNKEVARALAREVYQQIKDTGQIAQALKAGDLAALAESFQAVNSIEGSSDQARDNARHVRDYIATMAVTHPREISLASVQEWFVRLRAAGKSPKTLWNRRASLSRFCEFLIDRGHIADNPCRRARMPKAEKLPPRFLSSTEHERVLELARQHGIHAEVSTALYTGMRREELRRMRWVDVDFDRGVVIVPRSKSRRPRAIPLAEALRAVLTEQQAKTGGRVYVFPGESANAFTRRPASGMRRGAWWATALKPLQEALPIFTDNMSDMATGRAWHLFRHTFASRLVQGGTAIVKVSAWLGHSDIRTTMMYAHLAPGHDADIENA